MSEKKIFYIHITTIHKTYTQLSDSHSQSFPKVMEAIDQ